MSNIAPLLSLLKYALPFSIAFSGCTLSGNSTLPPLIVGKPALPTLLKDYADLEEITFSAKPPGVSAWRVRLVKKPDSGTTPAKTYWETAERTDTSAAPDRADSAFVEHLLANLATFTTEEGAGEGSESIFGMTPYRVEVRLRTKDREQTVLFGDPVAPTGIYFRRSETSVPGAAAKPESSTWIGRGALVTLLAGLQTPDIFVWRMPYLGEFSEVKKVDLAKLSDPSPRQWSFVREKDSSNWAGTQKIEAELLERLLRQRWSAIAAPASLPSPFPTKPDWRITLATDGRDPQTLEIFYVLDTIYARNTARSSATFLLYPEFAGTLRAFTQLQFTPVKSRKK